MNLERKEEKERLINEIGAKEYYKREGQYFDSLNKDERFLFILDKLEDMDIMDEIYLESQLAALDMKVNWLIELLRNYVKNQIQYPSF